MGEMSRRTKISHPEGSLEKKNELIGKYSKNFTSYYNADMKTLSGCKFSV